MDQFKVWVGIDWGSEVHHVCALDPTRKVLLEMAVAHTGEALVSLADKLLSLVAGEVGNLGVAIEVPRGPVVESLLERNINVFAINPKQLDRFRDRHTVAGAKDDRRDALVLADSLRTDQSAFRQVHLGDPLVVQLRELSRLHDEPKAERNAIASRLREQLTRYFPQILALDSPYDSPWIWALLDRSPTPETARRLSLAKIGSILRSHRIRRFTPEQVKEVLASEPLHVAPGVVEACRKSVSLLLPRLRLAYEQKLQVEADLAQLLEEITGPGNEGKPEHRDARLLQSLPGLGKLVCATMLAEAAEPLGRRDYATLRGLSGAAPVTKRSGKQLAVPMRRACNRRLRNALHFWAANAVLVDAHWKSGYAALRSSGHTHSRALPGPLPALAG